MKADYLCWRLLLNKGLLALSVGWLLTGLLACSANQAYSSFQAAQRTSCYSVPPENYDACMQEANKSYEEYEQELEEYEQRLKEAKKNTGD